MSEAKKMSARTSVDYEQLEKEKAQQIERNIQTRLANQALGKIHSLRHTVLGSVVRAEYEKANEDIDRFIASKDHFPTFRERTRAQVQHCKELINAIRAKRNFPGLAQLTMSKQQEILDHVTSHFEELKHVLKHIERVSTESALDDLRSTTWLLKTLSYVLIVIAGTAFMLDFTKALGQPLVLLYDDFTDRLWNLIASAFGL